MYFFVLFVFAFSAVSAQSGVECSYACDNPTADAVCYPVCAQPVCYFDCTAGNNSTCRDPRCHITCPTDGDAASSCPACSTECDLPFCPGSTCTIVCEPLNCSWRCREPYADDHRPPTCTRVCAAPACEAPAESEFLPVNVVINDPTKGGTGGIIGVSVVFGILALTGLIITIVKYTQ